MPVPPGPWEAEALQWAREGVTTAEAAKRWGVTVNAAGMRYMRALRRSRGGSGSQLAPSLSSRLDRLDARIEAVAEADDKIQSQLDAVLARMGEIEKRLEAQARTVVTVPATTAKPSGPPESLWAYITGECRAAISEAAVAKAAGVDINQVRRWIHGENPSARHRECLRGLLATIYARQSFGSYDDLEEARDRVMRYSGAGA